MTGALQGTYRTADPSLNPLVLFSVSHLDNLRSICASSPKQIPIRGDASPKHAKTARTKKQRQRPEKAGLSAIHSALAFISFQHNLSTV
jgi:hypothetical protein